MAPRLWLDATEPDTTDMSTTAMFPTSNSVIATPAKMNSPPPVPSLPASPPIIPPRNNSTPDTRRRSHHQQQSQTRKKSTHPGQAPPPPEVISNLIDSLANISFPDPTGSGSGSNSKNSSKHPTPNIQQASSFETNKPNVSGTISTPGSGRIIQLPMRSSSASATEFDVLKDHLSMNLHELIDDAAEPPVVRTVKPRVTPLTNGKSKIKKEGYGLGLFGTGTHSNSSLVSLTSSNGDESRGLGGLLSRRRNSLRSPSEVSLSYSDLEGQKSPISPTSPNKAAFVAKPVSKSERRRDSVGRISGMQSPKKASLVAVQEHPSPKLDEIDQENVQSAPENHVAKFTSVSSKKEGKKPRLSPQPPAVAILGPNVPDRRSSLIRTDPLPLLEPSIEPSKSRSPSVSPNLPNGSLKPKREESKPETRSYSRPTPKVEPKILTSHSSFDLLNGEDTEVTKRIKELKAKKEQRDREAREASTSPTPSPGAPDIRVNGQSATSTLVKSHGNSNLSTPKKHKRPQDIRIPSTRDDGGSSNHLRSGNASSRSPDADVDEPTTPLTPTPLPINYSFVVKSLDDDRPPSRNSESSPERNKNTWRRSMGSRSLFSGSSKKDGIYEDRARGSIERPSRKGASRRSNSLPRSKRWSDGGLERRQSLRADSTNGNSKSGHRSSTVPEERSSSPEPIDHVTQAVDDFMSAKRLSQKVRHPLNGRIVSFSEVGSPKGHTVFCCVGMGLTRYITAFYDELAYTLNLRIITPDRPGIGDSDVDPNGTPLSWPDDIILICQHLKITKFSLLAHSAGAIYALATALRIPQHIRGKVHLLAPWIPPSQMAPIGVNADPPPATQLPRGQRILRALPAQFLKVANSSLLSATSASLSPKVGMPPNASGGSGKKSTKRKGAKNHENMAEATMRRESILFMDQQNMPSEAISLGRATSTQNLRSAASNASMQRPTTSSAAAASLSPHNIYSKSASTPLTPTMHPTSSSPLLTDPEEQASYDELLTMRIWAAATTRANPAVDLVVCLEHSTPVGFRYVDITRACVVHHGTKDTRVPVENVKWLTGQMKRCEVRVLEGETHGLMASAGVMGGVLTEMAAEWEEWERVVRRGRG